jgi:signal transduction histidine kinase
MNTLSAFFERNIVTVFFLYGLAFFSMGLAVWLESRRASEFRIARAMGSLAGFGIIHGFHEWIEMLQRLGNTSEVSRFGLAVLDGLRVGTLALSFLLLMVFGARLIYSGDEENGGGRVFVFSLAGILAGVWLGSILVMQWLFGPYLPDYITAIDVLTRYMLGIPGALLAAWAMVLEQRAFRVRGMPGFGRDLLWAALAIFLYGTVGQIFPPRSFLFPSTTINSDLFLQLFGIPVQLFLAAVAGIGAVFMIRALRAFELESRQRLAAANEARLAAQRQVLEAQQRAHAETEQLNRDLQAAVQDLSVLFELSRSLASTLERDALLEQAMSKIIDSVPRIDAGMILLREKPDGPLQVMAQSACPPEDEGRSPIESLAQQARRVGEYAAEMGKLAYWANGEIAFLDNHEVLEDGLQPRPSTSRTRRYLIGVPLKAQDRIIGSLVLCTGPDTPTLANRDISLSRTIASQLSIAIENATLYREVQAREVLRGELLHQVVSAQEAERQRIARELHDGTGQTLTALGLGLAAARESVKSDPGVVARQLAELKTLSARALQELHNVVSDLRPSVLDDLGLVPALRGQVQDLESRTGVRAQFMVSGGRRRVQPEIETVLFRIAQEALTNVAKHAAAQTVAVRLIFADDAVRLTVQDDGCGFDPDEALRPGPERRRAWGLLGIQERVALVGGICQIMSQPGAGTTIQVSIPVTDNSTLAIPRSEHP